MFGRRVYEFWWSTSVAKNHYSQMLDRVLSTPLRSHLNITDINTHT